MQKYNDAMFKNQKEAGGLLGIVSKDLMPYNQVWLVGRRGQLMAKLTIEDWAKDTDVALCISEAIEFTMRKRDEPVTELWINPHNQENIALALTHFADPEIPESAVEIPKQE